MSRVVRSPVALFSLVGLLVVVPVVIRMTSMSPSAAVQAVVSTMTKRTALIRAGLGADVLAAAGVSTQQASTLVSLAESLLASQPTRLSAADAAYTSARTSKDALERKIQSGLASAQEISGFSTASSTLAAAEAERADALEDLFDAATTQLSEAQRGLLHTIAANRPRGLSNEFLTVNRTDAEWVALRNALSNERISAKNDETPNVACQSLLSTLRANATVAAAKSASDANIASISTTWDSATAD